MPGYSCDNVINYLRVPNCHVHGHSHATVSNIPDGYVCQPYVFFIEDLLDLILELALQLYQRRRWLTPTIRTILYESRYMKHRVHWTHRVR